MRRQQFFVSELPSKPGKGFLLPDEVLIADWLCMKTCSFFSYFRTVAFVMRDSNQICSFVVK